MKLFPSLIQLFVLCCIICASNAQNVVSYVNPLVGSDSSFDLSNGNTYPAIARPWGMNFWTPQTAENKDGWTYAYDSNTFNAIKQTHQASPWLNDYGTFSIMPRTGKSETTEEGRKSFFSHKIEVSKPHYYKVYAADYDVWAEVTPTERAARFRFTYPETDDAHLVIDAFGMGSHLKVEGNTITGYSQYNHGGVPQNFKNYFVIELDKPIESVELYDTHELLKDNPNEATGEHILAVVRFQTQKGEVVELKTASSFISLGQAKLNLGNEIGDSDFETIKQQGADTWNQWMGRIQVEGGSLKERQNFYTALYRCLLFPRKFYEIDAERDTIHYSPFNGKVEAGVLFTDNGFWDTFRAIFPLFTLVYPDMNAQMMQGLVNTYKESGWLPEWASPGHRSAMIGSNSAAIIADSYLKGIRGYDIDTLYEAILKNSENEGPLASVGRLGVDYYNKLGYVPYDVDIKENAARSLEYSFDDFCIYQLAKSLDRPKKEIELFRERADNYKKLFDSSTNFMRGKNKDGTFQSPFNPVKWGDAFTEGNAWHYTWSVFQDIEGLIHLMGGNKAFNEKLDAVFTTAPDFDYSYYGFQIHEITEMLIAGMGQYAHGNQPIQHGIYLYNYSGQPWKAQKRVREVTEKLYLPTPDGLCGDEDNGQTSAWYVFSAIGMYPVSSATNQYVFGSPLFDKITLHLENGNTFTIRNKNNRPENVYIQNALLNGTEYTKNFITHETLWEGGNLQFTMGTESNTERGTQPEDTPYSLSKDL
ncbi:glycoside hydrolase family 92 protein [Flavobacteriaceae bacterium TP-CH-4]|uniref:Glycoside hydrolase family 92 protein n=1 Tax=Pelagihabitans pacificus TaxID=2696054 RepID=A0A967ASH1_9FLAO|nr:GH92 family glycosyl hydrolase [Pelagihabitans pacificus]NHF59541.1 glycoside hydrolase family 92 protein [Pelagihabitans pacificus]